MSNPIIYTSPDGTYQLKFVLSDNVRSGIAVSEFVSLLDSSQVHKAIDIPGYVDGHHVSAINSCAFKGVKNIEHISLPNSVVLISFCAFMDSDIQSIHLGNSLITLGDSVFFGCSRLKQIHLPKSLKFLGPSVFKGCCELKSLQIPDSVKHIPASILDECTSLESIHIGAGLEDFGTLRTSSFAKNCIGLKSITVSPYNKHFMVQGDALFCRANKRLILAFNGPKKSFIIPKWTKAISNYALQNIHIDSLYIKSGSIFNIENAAFKHINNIYCIPGSNVEYSLNEWGIKVTPSMKNHLSSFLNNIDTDREK